jgi:hypothetical protein
MTEIFKITNRKEMLSVVKKQKLDINIECSNIIFNTWMFTHGLYEVFLKPNHLKPGKYGIYLKCKADNGNPCDICTRSNSDAYRLFNQKNFKRSYIETHLRFHKDSDSEEPDEATLPDPDEATPSPIVKKKRSRDVNISSLIIKHTTSLVKRIDEAEKKIAVLEKAMKIKPKQRLTITVDTEGGLRGVCMKCKNNIKDNNKRLKPAHLPLKVHAKMGVRQSTSIPTFKNTVCTTNKYCAICKDDMIGTRFIDTNNSRRMCVICRCVTIKKGSLCCAECETDSMQKNHAVHKKPIHETFKLIKEVVYEVDTVETSYLMQNGEFSVGDAGSIDFVVQIKLKTGELLLYVIEILSTKTEDIFLYSTKFMVAYNKVKPKKAFMIAFDIYNRAGEPQLAHRLDILRRWVIFTILYHKHIPSITNWWFFCNQRNAYSQQEPQATRFYKEPIMISKAPQPIATEAEWEFASDCYAHMEHETVNVNQMLFGNLYTKEQGGEWSKYNIDNEEDVLAVLNLTRPV